MYNNDKNSLSFAHFLTYLVLKSQFVLVLTLYDNNFTLKRFNFLCLFIYLFFLWGGGGGCFMEKNMRFFFLPRMCVLTTEKPAKICILDIIFMSCHLSLTWYDNKFRLWSFCLHLAQSLNCFSTSMPYMFTEMSYFLLLFCPILSQYDNKCRFSMFGSFSKKKKKKKSAIQYI